MSKSEKKPTHAKPSLYAYYFEALKDIAKEYGYNLVVHGSMNRDLDLIAIPWINEPKDEFEMIQALHRYLSDGISFNTPADYICGTLPGGRTGYVINLYRGGYEEKANGETVFTPDPQYYIDISVTPLPK